jgi:HEAT repeat protein
MKGKVLGANGVRLARPVSVVCFIFLTFSGSTVFAETPQEKAWGILQSGLSEHSTSKRAATVGALGLLPGDPRAIESAEKELSDKKAAVRAAAATALGQIGIRSSILLLKDALADKKTRVSFAAADSLISLRDSAGYDLYYEILIGERRSGDSWISEKKRLITDERAMVLLGLGVGIGFAPYAGYGWMVWDELSKDTVTPVHIAALGKLANDPDLRIGHALVRLASDKHTTVRVAALAAIAHHGDPSLICAITPHMTDKKAEVRYSAAAAVLRLSMLAPTDETGHTDLIADSCSR